MSDQQARKIAVHPHWCDCAGCWTGITQCAPKPKNWLQRLGEQVKRLLEEEQGQ